MIQHVAIDKATPTEPNGLVEDALANSYFPDVNTAQVEQVLADHTAMSPSRRMAIVYFWQALLTGLPLLLVDLALGAVALLLANYLVNLSQGKPFNDGILWQIPAYLILQTIFVAFHQLYPGAGVNPVAELRGLVRSIASGLIVLAIINILLGQFPRIEFGVFALAGLLSAISIPAARTFMRRLCCLLPWWGIRLLIVGRQQDCLEAIEQLLSRRSLGFKPVGFTCDSNPLNDYQSDFNYLGKNRDAVSIARKASAPAVAIVSPSNLLEHPERLVFQFSRVVWMKYTGFNDRNVDTSGVPSVVNCGERTPFLKLMPRLAKRMVDLTLSIPALVLLSPLFLVFAIAIRISSPGPIFYACTRVGQHGKRFRMWKFRSMVLDADRVLEGRLSKDAKAAAEWINTHKLQQDPRVIAGVGTFMRRCSLDELPQLWNVLKGEMSLVGPRPVPENEILRYASSFYEYTQMWPGITGLWQVSGRNDTSFETRVFLVHHYAVNWSPWLDIWILMKTPFAVLTKRGAY
jgi:Undecaprenyl-phosphate galactose phosphotransferase WbaP